MDSCTRSGRNFSEQIRKLLIQLHLASEKSYVYSKNDRNRWHKDPRYAKRTTAFDSDLSPVANHGFVTVSIHFSGRWWVSEILYKIKENGASEYFRIAVSFIFLAFETFRSMLRQMGDPRPALPFVKVSILLKRLFRSFFDYDPLVYSICPVFIASVC